MSEELTELDKVKAGAAILYSALNTIYSLHDFTELEDGDGVMQPSCEHCSEINGGIVIYPCPTVQVLLNDFVVEPVEEAKQE